MFYQKLVSPLGAIHIASDQQCLCILAIGNHWDQLKMSLGSVIENDHPILAETKRQLHEYFSGQRTRFDLPLSFKGTTFQKAAWNALLKIPYGETRSYAEQAQAIENPKAVRAVGRANGQNPISIIAPCHRVIGKSGKLTGYASGLNNKEYLLELEKRTSKKL